MVAFLLVHAVGNTVTFVHSWPGVPAGASVPDALLRDQGWARRFLQRTCSCSSRHVVIFHWNRLGLSVTTQGLLARAATAAFLPRS